MTPLLPQGTYDFTITLLNSQMDPVSVVSPALSENVVSGTTQVPIVFDISQVHFAWSITMNGQPATCAANEEVHVFFTGGGLTNAEFAFPCMSGGVMEGVLPILPGDYTVTAELEMGTVIESSTDAFPVHSPGDPSPIVFVL
jgi:hypothetical protein